MIIVNFITETSHFWEVLYFYLLKSQQNIADFLFIIFKYYCIQGFETSFLFTWISLKGIGKPIHHYSI